MKWIPVTERLPDEMSKTLSGLEGGERVLIYLKEKNMAYNSNVSARYYDGDWFLDHGGWAMGNQVTHWMPLPDPPEVT